MKNSNIMYELIVVTSLIIAFIFFNKKPDFKISSVRTSVNEIQLKEFIEKPVPTDIAKEKR